MKALKSLLLAVALGLCASSAFAQVVGDPCEIMPKSSAAITITTATTTSIVAPVTGQAIYVCGVDLVTGATTTWQFEYGTGAACATGLQAVTGVVPGASTVITPSQNATQLTTPVSQRLCVLSTGTGGIHGYINYVQE